MSPTKPTKEKIFIGVAWPYANGSLHLGHIAGCYLPADIFARYHKMKGDNVLMVSGSDEHGTPITITAEKENITPQGVVDRYHREHAENMKQFGISFDLFTRTTTQNHANVVQKIFLTLHKKGYIYAKNVDAFFCEQCNRFLPDRYVEGTCPGCGNEHARGDQCDNCGKLLEPQEIQNVKCKLCGGTPLIKKSEHLFFSLSKFEPRLLDWIKDKTYWKSNVLKFTRNWLLNGLNDRAITRDINWGIAVPLKGFEEKRLYVWFDAVIGYLSASKEWAQNHGDPKKWEHWWKDPKAKHYYFLAKDNIPFHSLIWPSILMGYDESLNLPYDIPANEYLCLQGEQFSKSRGVGIWVPDILKKFDADAIRYYLSINMPENKDANWNWADFIAKNNDELVGTYGNFIHRVLSFTYKNYGHIPKKGTLTTEDKEALKEIEKVHKVIAESLEKCEFKKGLRAVMNLAQYGNVYFDHESPWSLIKTDKKRCGTVLYVCLQISQALAVCMAPYLPFSSNMLWKLLGHSDSIAKVNWDDALLDLQEETLLQNPSPLFKKLLLNDVITEADPFSKLDLRVAKILEVKDHPQADKLYILNVDLGPLGKRVVVAGMKPFYTKEQITGKTIVLVANLKPALLRGVESKGMILAAEDTQGVVSLLYPKDASPGTEIFVEGIAREPAPLVEFGEFKQIIMTVNEKSEAVYNGKPLKTKQNTVVTDKPVKPGAKIL
ncbi:MAG: methionine--tRNA ligase [Euryarchaeota archaeon]|nr:methionine--tRNA ligase [Euryarchaeota archaeon]